MKIYEGQNAEGELIYFEISSLLTRWGTFRLISAIPDVKILKKPKRFSFMGEDAFCIFRMGNRVFEVLEPFGDNSRFHIGEKSVVHSAELETVKKAFSQYKPWPFSIFLKY